MAPEVIGGGVGATVEDVESGTVVLPAAGGAVLADGTGTAVVLVELDPHAPAIMTITTRATTTLIASTLRVEQPTDRAG